MKDSDQQLPSTPGFSGVDEGWDNRKARGDHQNPFGKMFGGWCSSRKYFQYYEPFYLPRLRLGSRRLIVTNSRNSRVAALRDATDRRHSWACAQGEPGRAVLPFRGSTLANGRKCRNGGVPQWHPQFHAQPCCEQNAGRRDRRLHSYSSAADTKVSAICSVNVRALRIC